MSQSQRRKKQLDYWGLMALMILFSILWHIWISPMWLIREVRPFGASQYSTRDVLNYLNSRHLTGQHLLRVNPTQIRQELLKFPLLKEVRVERRLFPALINLYLTERKPAFRIYQEIPGKAYVSSQSVLVDDEGMILKISDTRTPPHTVWAAVDASALRAGRLSAEHLRVLLFLNTLYQNRQLSVQGVYNISRTDHLVLRLPDGSPPVWLGAPEQLPLKLSLLQPLVDLAARDQRRVRFFDLRNWETPVIKLD
jgi:cell division septal protein FtsQ